MTIPSPKPFFEILAFTLFAFFTAMGIILAVVVLSVWVLVEKVVDGVKAGRRA
jgi:hypothetical protein